MVYKAEVTASNFHNYRLCFEISQKDLDELYDGNINLWQQAVQSGEYEEAKIIDEGTGGDIEIDGEVELVKETA